MQREQIAELAVRKAILDAEARIASIAHIHSYLHKHRSTQRIDLADLFAEVLPQIGTAIGIRCMLSTDLSGPMVVSGGLATKLTIIVNELALNAVKHGYSGAGGGIIRVGLGENGDGRLKLTFADGGTGLPDHFDPEQGDGLGLRIVTSLVEDLGGTLSFHNDGGAWFTILIPSD